MRSYSPSTVSCTPTHHTLPSADQETVARLAEADLITEDLERANSRVTEVERRNEKLRAEIEAVRSGSESAGRYVGTPPLVR